MAGYEYIGGNRLRTVYSEAHYARFAQMILNGGELEGRRYLSPGAFKHMTTDEVGPGSGVSRALFLFCRRWFWIRLRPSRAHRCGTSKTAAPGSVGEHKWDSGGGTYFGSIPSTT